MNTVKLTDGEREEINSLHEEIVGMAQQWAAVKPYDARRAHELRKKAILWNHRHYLKTIPIYAAIANEAHIGPDATLDQIREHLLFTDDMFKSYDPTWIDNRDFAAMNQWLGSLYHERIEFDTSSIRTIDQWIDALGERGIYVIFSSGSSGRFSFVPRCEDSWHRYSHAPTAYFAPLSLQLGIVSGWKNLQMRLGLMLLSPFKFADAVSKRGLPDYDGVFLAFREGRMGAQIVAQEFAKRLRKSSFMYEFALSASALRLTTRAPQDAEDERTLMHFRKNTIGSKDKNFARLVMQMQASIAAGQKLLMSGPPYMFRELAEYVIKNHGSIPLKKGSFIMTGGGWKTFTGEMIPQESLAAMIQEAFNVPPEVVVDGYSMSEINGVAPRCKAGRYHLPPLFEPMVFDDDLKLKTGKNLEGIFGFLDPFAISYPGFLISGDIVQIAEGSCACGSAGPCFTKIGRATRKEIKGCAGVMAAIQA